MTIAACHISPEGVVFGADSTSTVTIQYANGQQSRCYFDYEQKLFEVGPPDSTVGLVTWGLGRFGSTSHRTIAAKLGLSHREQPAQSMRELAERLGEAATKELAAAYPKEVARGQELDKKLVAAMAGVGPILTPDEEQELNKIEVGFGGGYFLGGRLREAEACEGYAVEWSPLGKAATISPLFQEDINFRGVPQIMERLIHGYDHELLLRFKRSPLWKDHEKLICQILDASELIQPTLLPMRDAVDWIHTVIHTTIRAMKFARGHVCGGPVEVAVITTDRPFRWVCHKRLDAAIITAQEKGLNAG